MSTSYDISAILDRLPEFTHIFERDGHTPHRNGTGWFALCPFHEEDSPSCRIDNDRRKFHCFGCGAAGDPFDYWQKRHNKSFKEALALVSIMGWHRSFPENVAVVALRGATSGRKFLQYAINPEAWIFAFADADDAGSTWFDPNGGLLAELTARLKHPSQLQGFMPSTDGADLNDLVKAGEIDREIIIGLIRPYLPNKHNVVCGPTFTQWCRKHKGDDPPIGLAAAYVLADPHRPRRRRPFAVWDAHWNRSQLPTDMREHLHAAWDTYQASLQP